MERVAVAKSGGVEPTVALNGSGSIIVCIGIIAVAIEAYFIGAHRS